VSAGEGQKIHAVCGARRHQSGTDRENNHSQRRGDNRPTVSKDREGTSQTRKECDKYGFEHSKDAKCTAKGKQYKISSKWNHFASKCCAKKATCDEVLALPEQSDSDSYFFIDTIETNADNDQAFSQLQIVSAQKSIKFKLDAGLQANIPLKHAFDSLCRTV
jgi:hypothetical protein